MSQQEDKRNVPQGLKMILSKDIALTKFFIDKTKHLTLFRSIKNHHRMLEVSCHGIMWLAVCLGSVWLLGAPSLYQLQANLLIALIFDIIVIAFLKAFTRRRRPTPAGAGDFGPDKFSFPSGHASRAGLLMYIFVFIHPFSILLIPPIMAWVTTVCFSRVIAERHYILDVIIGLLIGIVEGMLFSVLWLGEDTALYLINYLSDEKFYGGEYHV
ncbi:polyisoprenoid diphosphate/phosphate phosphohydrolase PLPP6-like [Arctopsyche grandis]|uniref:polyisoprenoid diphosphate/phosphate phosphohydrolase PLPP6-like n=1 Tax=Arctopsyche grandis TaxID=121162 RepID=UPI00406D70B1